MALTVTFGNGGAANVSDLLSADPNFHVLDPTSEKSKVVGPDGSSFDTTSVSVHTAPVAGSGTGGDVGITFDSATNSFQFDVLGKWNSVKNVLAQSSSAENVYFKDFVQADVHLGGTSSSSVELVNVKRANVTTGDGNDTVKISLLSNDNTWVNNVNVETGAGNDTITISAGTGFKATGPNSTGGITGASAVNGGNGVTDGSNTVVYIDAGAGNDTIDLSGLNLKSSTVIGGKGIDHMIASNGADTFVFNLGDMAKSIVTDTIDGFNTAMDKLKLVGTTESDWVAYNSDADTIVKYVGADVAHQNEKIVISNVDSSGFHNWFTA